MQRNYKISGIDCAMCASNLEKKLSKLSGVKNASLSFMHEKLSVEVDDSVAEQTFSEIVEVVKNFENGLSIKRI